MSEYAEKFNRFQQVVAASNATLVQGVDIIGAAADAIIAARADLPRKLPPEQLAEYRRLYEDVKNNTAPRGPEFRAALSVTSLGQLLNAMAALLDAAEGK